MVDKNTETQKTVEHVYFAIKVAETQSFSLSFIVMRIHSKRGGKEEEELQTHSKC